MKHETAYYYTEIQRMLDMECMIIPVITGAAGIVTKRSKEKIGSY